MPDNVRGICVIEMAHEPGGGFVQGAEESALRARLNAQGSEAPTRLHGRPDAPFREDLAYGLLRARLPQVGGKPCAWFEGCSPGDCERFRHPGPARVF